MVAELRYKPWGETRHTSGSTPTTYHFTGQREDAGLGGLYFYNARWYEPGVGRFVQADTLVPQPGDPQAFNRYMYALSNPLKYTDPSGHDVVFINGAGANATLDPTLEDLNLWADWIRAYKGWSIERLNKFLSDFKTASDPNAYLLERIPDELSGKVER